MGKLFVIEGTDSSGKQTQLEKLKNRFEKENIKYSKIYSERPTLNDVFLELTGKELRD